MTTPDEVLADTIPVETPSGAVAVEVWHHRSMNTDAARGYRLRRPDTGEERTVTAPMYGGRPARVQLAQAFVWGEDA